MLKHTITNRNFLVGIGGVDIVLYKQGNLNELQPGSQVSVLIYIVSLSVSDVEVFSLTVLDISEIHPLILSTPQIFTECLLCPRHIVDSSSAAAVWETIDLIL